MESREKIDAIYKLREAAEQKARAERDVDEAPTPQARDALLEAQMELEKTTYRAIKVCHECGHEHGEDEPHGTADNVVEFRRPEAGSD
ncbi:MAG TPA: hypothetical protein VGG89_16005 [Candidatus Baltobacteraceae bacterium]